MSQITQTAPTAFAVIGCLTVLIGCDPAAHPVPDRDAGVVVVGFVAGETADLAGIAEGDVIVGWQRGERQGLIEAPWELRLLELGLADNGPVDLVVARGHQLRPVRLEHSRWRLDTRPVLDPKTLSSLERSLELLGSGGVEQGLAVIDRLVATVTPQSGDVQAAWLHQQAGIALILAGKGQTGFERLHAGAELIDPSLARAGYWELAGTALLKAGLWSDARRALELAERAAESTAASSIHAHLKMTLSRTEPRHSEDYARHAVEYFESIGNRGYELALAYGRLATARYYHARWAEAEELYSRSIEIAADINPSGPLVCDLIGNLGLVAYKRGDLDGARRTFTRQLRFARSIGSPAQQVGFAANYLGLVSKKLGLYEDARAAFETALGAFRRYQPGGVEEAGVLNNLGNLHLAEDRNRTAKLYLEAALKMRERLGVGEAQIASSLNNLGIARHRLGDLEGAQTAFERALEIKTRTAPRSAWLANTLTRLGHVARDAGDLETAFRYHEKALRIYSMINPQPIEVAEGWFFLGRIARAQGRLDEAESLLRRASAMVETLQSSLQLDDLERARFSSQFVSISEALASVLVEQGRNVEAFELVESARSLALRATLASCIDRRRAIPTDLRSELTRLDSRIMSLERQRSLLDTHSQRDRIAEVSAVLADLYRRRAELTNSSRPASRVDHVDPHRKEVSIGDLRSALPPEATLVSYVSRKFETIVFALSTTAADPTVRAALLPITHDELDRRVGLFRALIERGATQPIEEPALRSQAGALYDMLLRPVLADAAVPRLLYIAPDGPLFDVPFSALRTPAPSSSWLGHVAAIVVNPSAGVALEIRRLTAESPDIREGLIAFGDPRPLPPSPFDSGDTLAPLPGSRAEVRAISSEFGDRVTTFIGADATESRIKQTRLRAGALHLAVHAAVNSQDPMQSALVLAQEPVGSSEDGFLRAWEIADQLDLRCRIVTLSACETAQGRRVEGEGMIGLARAFQVAGAPTIVVSQWPIADRPTFSLMRELYARILKGDSPVDALRAAQAATAAKPETRHPYFWAPFQVIGGWS